MKGLFICVSVMALVGLLLAQTEKGGRAPVSSHAETHTSDSYVVVLNKQAIMRGPDFSQREIALQNGEKQRLHDFVWFSTKEGCFLVADADDTQKVRDFEKTQQALNKRWKRDATNPALAFQLRQEQEQHTASRDEFIWTLFDNLKQQGGLASTKGNCSAD